MLFIVKRLGPLMYYEAELWRPSLSFKDKLGFLNAEQYQQRLAQLNPVPYRKLSQHKVAEKALLQLAGIPTPAFVGFFNHQKGFTYPHISFAGLDMAISETGPVIIELNLEPDKVTARNFDLPLKQLLL
ncbi:hypothetical protein [Lacimicrobium alkaliphilum]|uniref:Alpha-L-glutamate ligase-related protein ATP-grasp domain-containing protein n=1 Tax=Lacimicrobium alkaliphilum TaxID=1526571 RepID=A0ABQ1RAI2_9ALTE|nr:hypothetical protein [Lacimicrobium alkaliphilum]GGD63981.1 hypothetical protein GCM10011357_19210 [Lacimicrobium alkaliphilum]